MNRSFRIRHTSTKVNFQEKEKPVYIGTRVHELIFFIFITLHGRFDDVFLTIFLFFNSITCLYVMDSRSSWIYWRRPFQVQWLFRCHNKILINYTFQLDLVNSVLIKHYYTKIIKHIIVSYFYIWGN